MGVVGYLFPSIKGQCNSPGHGPAQGWSSERFRNWYVFVTSLPGLRLLRFPFFCSFRIVLYCVSGGRVLSPFSFPNSLARQCWYRFSRPVFLVSHRKC